MTKPNKIIDFGYDPNDSGHCFIVNIPSAKQESVLISEHLSGEDIRNLDEGNYAMGSDKSPLRVILTSIRWTEISEKIATEFNKRLRKSSKKTSGKWHSGLNFLNRSFGKELCVLAWAIEDADPQLIPTAIQNWLGLTPEERWWLYTMTNAATGHAVNGRGKGWRKAVRYALTENPVSERERTGFKDLLEIFDSPFGQTSLEDTSESKKKLTDDLPENLSKSPSKEADV